VSTAGHAGRPPVSVVIPSRDRPGMLDRCIGAVRAALGDDDEIVVVDSASRDADAVAAVAARHHARLVRCEVKGVNRARNAGWQEARHDLLLFTDDDVVVDAGWVDGYAAASARHPDVAFFTGWLGVPDGQHSRWDVAVKDDETPGPLTPATAGVLGHGASLAVRRDALVAVGGWDESLGSGGRFASAPEVDLFDRLLLSGRTGWFEPRARAWHDQWRVSADVVPLYFRYGVGSGARIAKLVRTDRRRAAAVAWECFWRWGLLTLGQRLRERDKTGTVVTLVRMAGYVVGFARAIATPVRDGHFRPGTAD
jgi:glycosyltransferase involved in cell wall biosynthesis